MKRVRMNYVIVEVMPAAKAHYADHCAICHGNDGRGTTLIGKGLYPKPPDMTQPATQGLTDGELYYIIENGIRFTGMPGFGEEVGSDQDKETWDAVGRHANNRPPTTGRRTGHSRWLHLALPAPRRYVPLSF